MQITFTLDTQELQRLRHLRLVQGKDDYQIPTVDPLYQHARKFIEDHKKKGYGFILLQLLHAAGVKMLGEPRSTPQDRSLFAVGGLYLILDITHTDLAIRKTFGDFTSGFSHQFGVALAVMSMSEAFGIHWNQLTPIPVSSTPTLDYEAQIPGTTDWLHLEAKGITSRNSRNAARVSAYCKKLDHPSAQAKSVNSPRRSLPNPTAMIGILIEASQDHHRKGVLEIIDPDYKVEAQKRQPQNQRAGRYWHYAGVARFAGLNNVADEFVYRARNLAATGRSNARLRQLDFDAKAEFERQGNSLVGLQWMLSDTTDPAGGIWFYHGVEKERIRRIMADDEFLICQPFSTRSSLNQSVSPKAVDIASESDEANDLQRRQTAENLLPDGSFFGIGYGRIEGLLEVDSQRIDLDELKIATLSNKKDAI